MDGWQKTHHHEAPPCRWLQGVNQSAINTYKKQNTRQKGLPGV
jgi:hypothetical protein